MASSGGKRRCGNTIHSDYVSDHRCVREHEHDGDCWFGLGIPHLRYVGVSGSIPIPDGFEQLALYVIVPPPYAERVE